MSTTPSTGFCRPWNSRWRASSTRTAGYSRRYLQDLSRLPAYPAQPQRAGPGISHLGRVKRVFAECYTQCITQTRTTVVMTFDTVEAMRGNYLLYTLTQWMKSLPGTLFVLSGRPMQRDPIQKEPEDPHQPMPFTVLELGPFDYQVAEITSAPARSAVRSPRPRSRSWPANARAPPAGWRSRPRT